MANESSGVLREQIRPTLIIGLGGTGKKCLLKIRRRFFDRYGDLDRFPSVAYLYLDTDTNDIGTVTEAGGHKLVAEAIDLANDEKVNITVASTAPYVDNPKATPHVADWFYPNLRDKGDLVQGAGAIRPYGRLAFFHNYDRVRTAIEKAIQRITDQRAREVTQNSGLRVVADNSVDVFIVGSIAGGTGSGTLLDTTFLVKHIAPGAKRYGFVVLPRAFGPRFASESRYANSYAALKEINHYTHRADANRVMKVGEMKSLHNFQVQWSLNEDVRQIPGPPFHYLYLVDAANERGITTDADGVYEMMADAIFYEFGMNDFGSQKRSIRDNTDQYLCKVALPPDEDGANVNRPQPKHYSSFGLARITFPVESVRGACAAMIGQKAVGLWERAGENPVSPQEIDQFMQANFLRATGLLDTRQKMRPGRASERDSQIVADIAATNVEGRSLFDELNNWIAQQRTDVQRLAGTRPVAALLKERIKDREFKMAGWDSDHESEWRDLARQLRSNLQVKQDRITAHMNREIENILADQARSLGFAQAALNRLCQIIAEEKTGYIDHFREERSRAEKDRNAMLKQMTDALLELEMDGDRMAGLPVWKTMTVRYLAERAIEAMRGYFEAQVRAAVAGTSLRLCMWLQEQLREENTYGLRSKLAVVASTLAGMKAHLRAQEERYKQVPQHSGQIILFEPKDLPDIYRYLIAGKEEDRVRDLSRAALAGYGGNLFGLIGAVQRQGVSGVAEDLLRTCSAPFAEKLRTDPKFEAMRLFQQKYGDDKVQMDKLRSLFDASRAWIQFRQDLAGKEGVKLEQRAFIVGRYVPDDAPQEYYDFDQQLERAAGADTLIRPYRTDARNEVVIYCEVAGYPLFLLQSLEDMREAYKAARDQEAKLHIDHHSAKFGDLVPIVGEAYRQYKEVVRGFVLAQALGMIKIKPHQQSGLPVFVMPVERGFGLLARDEHLGYEDTAIERLGQRAELRRSLLDQVNRRLAQVSNQGPEAMAALYAVLADYSEVIYPAQLMEGHGGAYEYENPIFTAALDDEMAKIRQDWEEVEAWKLAAVRFTEERRRSRRLDFARQLAPDVPGLDNRLVLNF
jgi:hypothetical protein